MVHYIKICCQMENRFLVQWNIFRGLLLKVIIRNIFTDIFLFFLIKVIILLFNGDPLDTHVKRSLPPRF